MYLISPFVRHFLISRLTSKYGGWPPFPDNLTFDDDDDNDDDGDNDAADDDDGDEEEREIDEEAISWDSMEMQYASLITLCHVGIYWNVALWVSVNHIHQFFIVIQPGKLHLSTCFVNIDSIKVKKWNVCQKIYLYKRLCFFVCPSTQESQQKWWKQSDWNNSILVISTDCIQISCEENSSCFFFHQKSFKAKLYQLTTVWQFARVLRSMRKKTLSEHKWANSAKHWRNRKQIKVF